MADGRDAPGRRPGVRAVFARAGYRRLWLARTASGCGDVFAAVALALLVFDLTGSPVGLSGVVAVEIVAVLVFAPLAGILADRFPPRRVMVVADVWRAVLALTLVVFADRVGAVGVIAFGLPAGAVVFNPAANSVLPTLAADTELIGANSGIWTAAVAAQIALAPAAGAAYTPPTPRSARARRSH